MGVGSLLLWNWNRKRNTPNQISVLLSIALEELFREFKLTSSVTVCIYKDCVDRFSICGRLFVGRIRSTCTCCRWSPQNKDHSVPQPNNPLVRAVTPIPPLLLSIQVVCVSNLRYFTNMYCP